METILQLDFKKAIRRRQSSDKRCLNPEDVRKALELAIEEIIKENDVNSENSEWVLV